MVSLEIIVGQEWPQTLGFLHGLRHSRPHDSRLDLTEIRDIIDIVVDGRNLTARIAEEAVFALMADLLAALRALVEGRSRKAMVEFPCEPWELVLVPQGRLVWLSLYSVDRQREVLADNICLEGETLMGAVTEVAGKMLAQLLAISDRFEGDGFVRALRRDLEALRSRPTGFFPTAVSLPGGGPLQAEERVGVTSQAGDLTLSYRYDPGHPNLRHYTGEHALDTHALLFEGVVEVETGGQCLALCERHPWLVVRAMAEAVRELLQGLAAGRRGRLLHGTPLGPARLGVAHAGRTWRLEFSHQSSTLVWEGEPHAALEAMLSLCELFVRDIASVHRYMELNERLGDLEGELGGLRRWLQDLRGENTYHDQTEGYLRREGHVRPEDPVSLESPALAWNHDQVRRVFARSHWRREASQIQFDQIIEHPRHLVVPTSEGALALSRETGEVLWTYPADPARPLRGVVAAGHWGCVLDPDVGLSIVDLAGGALTGCWPGALERWGRLVAAASYPGENLVLVADAQGHLVALQPEGGEVRWTAGPAASRSAGVAVDGPLVACLTCDGLMWAHNVRDGQVLWRVRLDGHCETPPIFHHGRLYAVSQDPGLRTCVVHAFHALSGRPALSVRLEGMALGAPSFAGTRMMLPVEREGRTLLCALPAEQSAPEPLWEIELDSAGLRPPTPVLPASLGEQAYGVIKTDRGEHTCLRLDTGKVRWRQQPGPEAMLAQANLAPCLVGGRTLLTVHDTLELRSLVDGALMHSFWRADGAEYMRAWGRLQVLMGERGQQGDEPDSLTLVDVGGFMAVVK